MMKPRPQNSPWIFLFFYRLDIITGPVWCTSTCPQNMKILLDEKANYIIEMIKNLGMKMQIRKAIKTPA